MLILILLILLISAIIGYNFPRKSSWFWLFILPIAYPTYFIILKTDIIPLTFDKLAFATSIGIFIRKGTYFKCFFKKIRLIKYIFIFYLTLVLFSSRDEGVKTIVFTTVPQLFTAIILSVIVVKEIKDINNLFFIFILQGTLLGVFIIGEFMGFKPINIYTLNPELALKLLNQTDAYEVRSGFYRSQGIDGNSVQTAYRMIMYLPLTLWWFFKRKSRLLSLIPFFIIISSIVLLQSRATYTVLSFSMALTFYYIFKINTFSIKEKLKLTSILAVACFSFVILSVYIFPAIFDIINKSFINNIFGSRINFDETVVRGRGDYFLNAFHYFLEKPFFGYGSPNFGYKKINYDDNPSFAIYALSGGIVLLIAYIIFMYNLLKITFKWVKIKTLNKSLNNLPLFVFLAVLNGFLVTLFNWQEAHFLTMFLFLFSILGFVHNKKIAKGILL